MIKTPLIFSMKKEAFMIKKTTADGGEQVG